MVKMNIGRITAAVCTDQLLTFLVGPSMLPQLSNVLAIPPSTAPPPKAPKKRAPKKAKPQQPQSQQQQQQQPQLPQSLHQPTHQLPPLQPPQLHHHPLQLPPPIQQIPHHQILQKQPQLSQQLPQHPQVSPPLPAPHLAQHQAALGPHNRSPPRQLPPLPLLGPPQSPHARTIPASASSPRLPMPQLAGTPSREGPLDSLLQLANVADRQWHQQAATPNHSPHPMSPHAQPMHFSHGSPNHSPHMMHPGAASPPQAMYGPPGMPQGRPPPPPPPSQQIPGFGVMYPPQTSPGGTPQPPRPYFPGHHQHHPQFPFYPQMQQPMGHPFPLPPLQHPVLPSQPVTPNRGKGRPPPISTAIPPGAMPGIDREEPGSPVQPGPEDISPISTPSNSPLLPAAALALPDVAPVPPSVPPTVAPAQTPKTKKALGRPRKRGHEGEIEKELDPVTPGPPPKDGAITSPAHVKRIKTTKDVPDTDATSSPGVPATPSTRGARGGARGAKARGGTRGRGRWANRGRAGVAQSLEPHITDGHDIPEDMATKDTATPTKAASTGTIQALTKAVLSSSTSTKAGTAATTAAPTKKKSPVMHPSSTPATRPVKQTPIPIPHTASKTAPAVHTPTALPKRSSEPAAAAAAAQPEKDKKDVTMEDAEPEPTPAPAPPQTPARKRKVSPPPSDSDSEADSSPVQPSTSSSSSSRPAPPALSIPSPFPQQSMVVATKKFAHLTTPLIGNISSHRFANLFSAPVPEKNAPGYKNLIYKPQDIKSIKAAIKAGAASLNALHLPGSTAATPTTADTPPLYPYPTTSTATTITTPATTANTPPKGIVNSQQLEKEIFRMFANAVMYNKSSTEIVKETVEMAKDVQGMVDNFRAAEEVGAKKLMLARKAVEEREREESESVAGSVAAADGGEEEKKARRRKKVTATPSQ
ncbi:hypothetical protein FN846DRAFT_21279 [Sphaerosporella brunnea]|uniref:Bromo domain-containing protein n=1 Tax=Sphaerosporella brunnea TaxID=1250544 RepID=A0A5J5EV83_9PEZI|nr:hypothetical protein FN846DRAFT_21279 [Sphaerosporella brunnea]